MAAMFIRVDVTAGIVEKTPGLAQKIIESCPVKIFKAGAGNNSVAIVEDNLDECTLCDLCTQACPDGIKVIKLYED
jgi:NAD-dependent dihydropyrimidine dehydrogenase PreA subunit